MLKKFLQKTITVYQKFISPLLGPHCRYRPTCSEYAHEAIAVHGACRGLMLGLRRVLRCNTFFRGGNDPVPRPENRAPEDMLFASEKK